MLRIGPIDYFIEKDEKDNTGNKKCPLCRSDRDIHWEMSHVPSDNEDPLDMMNDSDDSDDSDDFGDEKDNQTTQPPAKRQKLINVTNSNQNDDDDNNDEQTISKMNRKQLEHTCKRLEREVTEYKSKMKEVCDSADTRFKEEKRLRKEWNKAQASMQARAADAEELVETLQKKLICLQS